MVLASGDRAVLVRTADGNLIPLKCTRASKSGERCVLMRTADGALVPLKVSGAKTEGNRCILARTADGEIVPVKFAAGGKFCVYVRVVTFNPCADTDTYETPSYPDSLFYKSGKWIENWYTQHCGVLGPNPIDAPRYYVPWNDPSFGWTIQAQLPGMDAAAWLEQTRPCADFTDAPYTGMPISKVKLLRGGVGASATRIPTLVPDSDGWYCIGAATNGQYYYPYYDYGWTSYGHCVMFAKVYAGEQLEAGEECYDLGGRPQCENCDPIPSVDTDIDFVNDFPFGVTGATPNAPSVGYCDTHLFVDWRAWNYGYGSCGGSCGWGGWSVDGGPSCTWIGRNPCYPPMNADLPEETDGWVENGCWQHEFDCPEEWGWIECESEAMTCWLIECGDTDTCTECDCGSLSQPDPPSFSPSC